MNCIFLDFDGPMIPAKAFYLPSQTKPARLFDPCATGMLLNIISESNSKIVISSIHRKHGYAEVCTTLIKNNIDPSLLHIDWATTTLPNLTRSEEIQMWLDDHQVDQYIAIDDELLDESIVSTKCCGYEGFSMVNFLECKVMLGVYDKTLDISPEVQLGRTRVTLNWIKNHK